MSLKPYAMLAAISYNQQQQLYSNNNSNNNNSNLTTNIATTIASEALTKILNSNKSSLIQLKQQQHLIAPTTTAAATTATTAISSSKSLSASVTPSVLIPAAVHPFHGDKTSTHVHHIHTNGIGGIASDSGGSSSSNSAYFDDDNDNVVSGEESSEVLEPNDNGLDVPRTPPQQHQPNTYTSTTYYGSGFGVFHQQNIRTNGGGGIALITGSSGNSGLGGSSYSNGINNNVNLLLGGAMLTLISTILCVVCYCCHRNIKKRTEAAYRQQRQWLENDPNMEIYSVEQCYETSGLFVGDSMDGLATIPALHHEPPPSYDAVVAMQEQQQLLMQQQQLLMQQQLLQQQSIPTNNSPPPGYRSSLDVSSIMPQPQRSATGLGSVLGMGGSIVSGMDVNSLASSTVNIGTSNSHSPVDPLMNYNDVNGNVDTSNVALTVAVTPTNNNKTINFLRNKQHQQQRNMPQTQLSQLNMKKVLQAQSCCSLQRAEVENMWNAAAAALAARSSHIPNDTRSVAATAVATASTSSPMLAMNVRKLSQGYANSSKSNTPETFGSRYLKQNYYRSGCPLCGKFRYDNDSQLSISMESNLDTLQGALNETRNSTNDLDRDQRQTERNDLNGNENKNIQNGSNSSINDGNENNNLENEGQEIESLKRDEADSERDDYGLNNEAEDDDDDDDDDNECKTIEQHCSCTNSRRKLNRIKYENHTRYQKVNLLKDNNDPEEQDFNASQQNEQDNQTNADAADTNANANVKRQSTITHQASNNNLNDNTMDMPSTSTAAATSIPRTTATSASLSSSSATSIPSVTINLDCINENGIISLDMSKIIDKTGLPTYDAALKLESSGYV